MRKKIADITDSMSREDEDTGSLLAEARAARGVKAHSKTAAVEDLVREIEEHRRAQRQVGAIDREAAAGRQRHGMRRSIQLMRARSL